MTNCDIAGGLRRSTAIPCVVVESRSRFPMNDGLFLRRITVIGRRSSYRRGRLRDSPAEGLSARAAATMSYRCHHRRLRTRRRIRIPSDVSWINISVPLRFGRYQFQRNKTKKWDSELKGAADASAAPPRKHARAARMPYRGCEAHLLAPTANSQNRSRRGRNFGTTGRRLGRYRVLRDAGCSPIAPPAYSGEHRTVLTY